MNVPVLILGETGTGKSMLGRPIHHESPRREGPYLAVNCAGIPDSLFESEFFGHQRGAFTGAREGRRGFLEQAKGGTLFLDEVGELALAQQAKLLMALEDREIRRLGSEGTLRVDVRVMAGTSRDLVLDVQEGVFRRDLFHRLAVLTCRIPPLRSRQEDISLLARSLLKVHQTRHNCSQASLPPEAMEYLEKHWWPGNVRELSHLLEAALILSGPGPLRVDVLEDAASMAALECTDTAGRSRSGGGSRGGGEGERHPLNSTSAEPRRYSFSGTPDEEREAIRGALRQVRGNRTRAARRLGMARNTLRKKMMDYGLD